jgi:PAS domain S-box-containing protein
MTTDLITAHPHLMPFGNVFDAGILYPLYLTYIAGCIFFGLMLSVRSFLKSDGVERKRNLFVIIGVSVPLVGGVLSAIFTILGVFNFPPTTTLSTVTVAFVSYAIIRYRLMSITTEIAAESMLRTMADYLVVLDRERRVAIISDSVKELTGRGLDKLAGKSISEALGEKTHVLSKIMDDLERTGKTIKDRETYIMVKGGEYTSFSVNASVIKDGTGRVIGFVLIMRDMSQVKKLIKGIEEKTKELEKSKRQLERNNEELATFNKMAVGRELKMIELKKKIEGFERGRK